VTPRIHPTIGSAVPGIAELVVDPSARCGESPLWDGSRLTWNDMNTARIFRFDPATGENQVVSDGFPVAGMALNLDGSLVLAGAGLHLWQGPADSIPIVTHHETEPLEFNDILADPAGRVYGGTYHWGEHGVERPGSLYLIEPDGRIERLDTGFQLANGLGLSPDHTTLYLADSLARRIYSYPVEPDTGRLGERSVFVEVPPTEGMPDGLTVDAGGGVWSAQWYGGRVVRYTPDGSLDRSIGLPVSQVASLGFGGADLDTLYVTTAAELWPTGVEPPGFDPIAPLGGGLYRVDPGVRGMAEHRARFDWPAG
jgi:D-xylono/L-arabinono-1,4-lactonase